MTWLCKVGRGQGATAGVTIAESYTRPSIDTLATHHYDLRRCTGRTPETAILQNNSACIHLTLQLEFVLRQNDPPRMDLLLRHTACLHSNGQPASATSGCQDCNMRTVLLHQDAAKRVQNGGDAAHLSCVTVNALHAASCGTPPHFASVVCKDLAYEFRFLRAGRQHALQRPGL